MSQHDLEAQMFGPAEVAHAARIPRATFHSWMARRYLPSGSPGRGKAREFSLIDALRIGAMVQMTRVGISVAQAADFTAAIEELPEPGDYLLASSGMLVRVLKAGSLCTLSDILVIAAQRSAPGGHAKAPETKPPKPAMGVFILDLFELLNSIKEGLSPNNPLPRLNEPDPGGSFTLTSVFTKRDPEGLTVIRTVPPPRRRNPKKA